LQRTILVLVLGVLIFGPLALGGVRPSEFIILQWLITCALGIWLLRIWVAPRFKFLLPPTTWALVPFIVYAIWRYRTADIEYLARQELIQVLLAAVFLLVVVNNLYGQTDMRIVSVTLVALGTLIAMYGIYQWLTGSPHVWHFVRQGYESRGSGTYICPNHLAGFLEMICPLAICFTLLRGFGAVTRILFAYASFVMLVGIASTGSRAGWLAAAVGVAVLSVILIRKRSHLWAALALLLVVGGTGHWLYSRILRPRIQQGALTGKYEDIRFRVWTAARQMWLEHPWVGIGPDHFDFRYRNYRPPQWDMQGRPGRAHNDYWNTLADWGVIGLILVLLPVAVGGAGIVVSWRYLQRAGELSGSRISVVLGSAIGLVSILVHSFFDFNMHIPANAFLAVTLLALIAAHWRFASQRFWLTVRWPARLTATFLLAATGIYLATQAFQHTMEALALKRADTARPASSEKIIALQEAFQHEPKNGETAFQIGEQFRIRSWGGDRDYKSVALEALRWFQTAAELNPWDPHARIRAGMCLDWIERPAEAEPYFVKALQLDPNHAHTVAMMGWHYFQTDRFAESCVWLQKALEIHGFNETANTYLPLAKKALADKNSPGSSKLPVLTR
jgi:O-antigen ligase/cytochrome c-type biogenesis protein CcmH/NrfG